MSKIAIYQQIKRLEMGEAEGVYRPLGSRSLRIKQDAFLRARASKPPSTNSDRHFVNNARRLLAAMLPLKTEIDHLIAEANEVYEAGADSNETVEPPKPRKSRRTK